MRWVVWTVFILSWTVVLEMPVPNTDQSALGEWIIKYRVYIAKSIHVTAYFILAVLSAWVPLPQRYRPLMMYLVMAHATATELLQNVLVAFSYRGGTLLDVGIDHLGIGLGMLVSWKWWMRAGDVSEPGA